ncbi:MAG: nitrous oxide-stimulated promoter family protein [Fibrobacterales bacterium]
MSYPFTFNEIKIVNQMILLYCKKNHSYDGTLCSECRTVAEYSEKRVKYCPIKQKKPVCNVCTVHCYSEEMRQKIIIIMRYSGPRMILFYPLSAIQYLFKKYISG